MPRRLHIGGKIRQPGWEVLNIQPGPHVDHIGNANDLAQFPDNSFAEIYASHIVEHLDYTGELQSTLKEWYRVLELGGKLYVSVPDLDVLAKFLLDKIGLAPQERFNIMRIMFGGHVDQFDYHVVGLNQEFLTRFLVDAGFAFIRKVDTFNMFQDSSNIIFKGKLLSLNLIAEKALLNHIR
jgi:predicted SAM-dependent methyltransferase